MTGIDRMRFAKRQGGGTGEFQLGHQKEGVEP